MVGQQLDETALSGGQVEDLPTGETAQCPGKDVSHAT
jgi:hypothetical protein